MLYNYAFGRNGHDWQNQGMRRIDCERGGWRASGKGMGEDGKGRQRRSFPCRQ
ncbi:hypothetical protein JCM15764A_28770 [Geotalea toluenoxydans]